jgi:hypothetical protein
VCISCYVVPTLILLLSYAAAPIFAWLLTTFPSIFALADRYAPHLIPADVRVAQAKEAPSVVVPQVPTKPTDAVAAQPTVSG